MLETFLYPMRTDKGVAELTQWVGNARLVSGY